MMPPNPLYAAGQVQNMASKTGNEKLATAMMVTTVALLGLMLVKEFKDVFKGDDRGHFPDRGRGR
jgi:hypothetical protein